MSDNPVAPFSRLMQRLAKECQEEGLNLFGFSVIPNMDPDGSHHAQALFTPLPDWGKTEDAPDDPEFAEFVKAQEKFDQEQRADEAREQLRGLADGLKDPSKGLGLDD